jgi:hypothetical protein
MRHLGGTKYFHAPQYLFLEGGCCFYPKGMLAIEFKSTPRMSGTLDDWQYDSFVTRYNYQDLLFIPIEKSEWRRRIQCRPIPPLVIDHIHYAGAKCNNYSREARYIAQVPEDSR